MTVCSVLKVVSRLLSSDLFELLASSDKLDSPLFLDSSDKLDSLLSLDSSDWLGS